MQSQKIENLSTLEMISINGGSGGFWAWLGQQVIDNWDDIKSGVIDGWNTATKPKQ